MLILLYLILTLSVISATFACLSNDECSYTSSEKPLRCHPTERKCTDCIINSDCQPPFSYCSSQGFCIDSIGCISSSDCRLISSESICQDRVCSIEKNYFLQSPQEDMQTRNLAVTTTLASTRVGSIDFSASDILITKDKKTLFATDKESKLALYSLENPLKPSLIVNLNIPCDSINDMSLSDDEKTLYIGSTGSLCIFDIENLTASVILQQSDLNIKIIQRFKNSPFVAIATFSHELTILDVSSPQNTSLVFTAPLSALPLSLEIIRNETFLLVTTLESLYVIDITNIAAPNIRSLDLSTELGYLTVLEEQNLAVVFLDQILVLNISDLNNVTILGSYITNANAAEPPKIETEMMLMYVPVLIYGVLIIDISKPSNMKEIGRISTKIALSLASNFDFTILYVADNTEIIVFQTDQYTSSVSNDILGLEIVDLVPNIEPYSSVLSLDESLLYVCTQTSFLLFDVSSEDSIPVLLRTIDFVTNGCYTLKFAPDYNYLYVSSFLDGIYIVDVSDPRNPVNVSVLLPMESDATFDLSADGNLLVSSEVASVVYRFFNITVKHAPVQIRSFQLRVRSVKLFKKDPEVLAVTTGQYFRVYNISNTAQLKLIRSIRLSSPFAIGLNEDESYAFVADSKFGIRVIDISNFSNISVLATIPGAISWGIYYNPYTKFLYVADFQVGAGIYVYDVSDPLNALIAGIIPAKDQYDIQISKKNVTYLCDAKEGLKVIEMKAKYVLKTSTSTSPLGIRTDVKIDVGIFWRNKYIPYNSVYKITEISLFKIEIEMISGIFKQTFSPLASWMSSDFAKGIVSFSPDNQQHLGEYNIFIKLSTIVDKNSFSAIENITDIHDFYINNLLGKYLDGEGYLNPNFDPQTELVLDAKYSGLERDIRHILSKSYVQSVVEINVVGSLQVTNSTVSGYLSLSLDTPTLSSVSIRLTFANRNSTFMDIAYETSALLRYISSGVVISGSKFDVNIALGLLRVDLSGVTSESDGQMVLNDGLNPVLTMEYSNMTRFFRINQRPYENIFIQDQLDSMSILTGSQFNFILNPLTFIDPDHDILSYNLASLEGKNLPNWINLVGNTLVGTPPNELGLQVTLKIIASDGYKKTESIFTIKVTPSPVLILSLIGKYIGPIIGAVGLWIYAIAIYNILFKKTYTFPKTFFIKPRTDINNNMIFPIALYGFELEEASKILFEIKKSFKTKKEKGEALTQEIQTNKNLEGKKTNYDNNKLDFEDVSRYLTKSDGTVDSKKLEDLVEETVGNKYSNFPHQRNMILDIIKAKLHMILIENNKPTYTVFKVISRRKWGELCRPVQNSDKMEDNLHFNLELNEMVFKKRLGELGFQPPIQHELDKDLETIPENDHSFASKKILHKASERIRTNSLMNIVSRIKDAKHIDFTKVNIPLLREALLAFFKAKYNVAVPFTRINFKCFIVENKTGLVANLKKFLKLNLTELAFNNKNFVGFGMKYKIQNNTVYFYGRPYREFESNTIVFQIVSKNGKILREISMMGLEDEHADEAPLIEINGDESEEKGSTSKGQELKLRLENSYHVIKSDVDESPTEKNKNEIRVMEIIDMDIKGIQKDYAKNKILKD